MVNVNSNLTYSLHKEVVCCLQRINIFMELFLRELYFLADVYNILTNLPPKESSSSFSVYLYIYGIF